MDGDVLAGLTQAIATIIAVIIGYALSTLHESKTAKRTARDQRRTSLLDVLVDFLDSVSLAVDSASQIVTAFASILDHATAGATARAVRDAQLAEAQARSSGAATDLRRALQDLDRCVLSVQVHGGARRLVDAVETLSRDVHQLQDVIDTIRAGHAESVTKADEIMRSLERQGNGIILLAREI